MFGKGKKKKDGNAKNSAKGTKRPNSQSASTKASKASQTEQKQRKRAATNRSFDDATTTIRRGVIDQCVKKKEAHLAEREKAGKSQCAQGFMKKMIEEIKETCPALDIEIDDVENEFRKKKKSNSNKAAKTNPPTENPPPSFVVQGRRLSSASSSVVPTSSQPTNAAVLPSSEPSTSNASLARNPLCLLADAAGSVASKASSRIKMTLSDWKRMPNRCSYPKCGAFIDSVPVDCQLCGSEKVHLVCCWDQLNGWCPPEEIKCAKCLATSQESLACAPSNVNVAASSTDAPSNANVAASSTDAPLNVNVAASSTDAPSNVNVAASSTDAPSNANVAASSTSNLLNANVATSSTSISSNANVATSSTDAPSNANVATSSTSAPTQRSKGGRPSDTTDQAKQEQIFNEKKAVNWVCQEYDTHVKAVKEYNSKRRRASEKMKRVEVGTRASLVKQAIEKFNIKNKSFDVPKQTINSRIKNDNLEVWHPGSCSPVAWVEVLIKAHIIAAARVNAPLSVSNIIALVNKLLEGTNLETELRNWKQKHSYYDPAAPLLGRKWFANFMQRNPDLESKYGAKFARNRDGHTHDAAFSKMGDQIEDVLLDSGNAVKFDTPVHMDKEGRIVEDESKGFGRPVTTNIVDPSNVFVMDETGDNTCGKNDGNNAGEKKVVPKGQVPKERVGIKDAHYTVVPINDLTGRLRCVAVIFKGEKVVPSMAVGCDPFADFDDDDYASNFGPGKRFPGLPIHDHEGKEVPVVFAATTNASMTSTVLMQIFEKMDEKGISKREYDSNGKLVKYPVVILDGHVSRMGEDFLVYINEDGTFWGCVLGAPYGTHIYQFHDDPRQNGRFKCELARSKSELFIRKRQHGLDPEVLPEDIVTILRPAIEGSFANIAYAKSALAIRGMYPFNRNYLDPPEILSTASEDTQAERMAVLRSRGQASNLDGMGIASQRDLLATGSGLLAGGAGASEQLQDTLRTVNLGNNTTEEIMSLIQNEAAVNEGRRNAYTSGQTQVTREELTNIYSNAKRLTAGEVFGNGNGRLGPEIRDAVVARKQAADQHDAAKEAKNKARLRELWKKVRKVRREMKKTDFTWTNDKLKVMIQWKKIKSDKKMPTDKTGLLGRWEEVKDRPNSPTVSVHESDNDESSVDESMIDDNSDEVLDEELDGEEEDEEEIPLEDGSDDASETGLEFSDNEDFNDELSDEEDGSEDEEEAEMPVDEAPQEEDDDDGMRRRRSSRGRVPKRFLC